MPNDLLGRVERLERANRAVKMWAGVAIAGMATLALMVSCNQASTQEESLSTQVVEAQKFVLRDNDGVMRAALLMTEEGAGLQIYDSEGTNVRVLLTGGSNGRGGQLQLWDQKDVPRFALHTLRHGETQLSLSDRRGYPSVILRAGNVPLPGVHVYDDAGIHLWERLENLGIRRAFLNLTKDGREPSIEFRDRDEKTTWKAPPK